MIRVYRALEAIALLPAKVDRLTKEVLPNGGGSLRDAVDRLATGVDALADQVTVLSERHTTRWKIAFGAPSWETDEYGNFLGVNADLCDLVGLPEVDLLGTSWKVIIFHEDQPRVFREWDRIIEEKSHLRLQCRIVDCEGEPLSVQLNARYMKVHGEVFGWIGKIERVPLISRA